LRDGVPGPWRAVLVSPHVNLATDIDSAKAGWVAAVDKESIKTALVEALSSKPERQRRGLAGRDLASKFSWPTIAASLHQLYESILPKTRAAN
jgi:glycosyltransferase involved in cell wall biosynthesis